MTIVIRLCKVTLNDTIADTSEFAPRMGITLITTELTHSNSKTNNVLWSFTRSRYKRTAEQVNLREIGFVPLSIIVVHPTCP